MSIKMNIKSFAGKATLVCITLSLISFYLGWLCSIAFSAKDEVSGTFGERYYYKEITGLRTMIYSMFYDSVINQDGFQSVKNVANIFSDEGLFFKTEVIGSYGIGFSSNNRGYLKTMISLFYFDKIGGENYFTLVFVFPTEKADLLEFSTLTIREDGVTAFRYYKPLKEKITKLPPWRDEASP